MPEHLGVPSLQATVFVGAERSGSFSIRPGWNEGFFELPLSTRARHCAIELDRSWVPASCGIGTDTREVGLMVEAIEAIAEVPPPAPPGLWERIRRRARREWRREELQELRREVASLEERLERPPAGYPVSADLEDLVRGPRELVKERQRQYLPRFAGKRNVLDAGCGRGEFLELLAEQGVEAWGVESVPVFAEACREKGLRVVEEDPLSHLESLPDGSLDGFFCSRLVDRMPGKERYELLRLAKAKIAPGSFVVLETPNPKRLAVAAESFWLDPTRVAPVPPELLASELDRLGYEIVELRYMSETLEHRLAAVPIETPGLGLLAEWRSSLNELLFGASVYALVVRRPE